MSFSASHRVRLTAVLLVLLAAVAAGAWHLWFRDQQPEALSEPRTFHDPKGYRLTVPAGWALVDKARGDGLIRADISRGEAGVQVRVQEVRPERFGAFVTAAAESYRADIAGHWGGTMHDLEQVELPVGDQATTFRFRFERSDGSTWYLQDTLVRKGSIAVIFQGGAPWNQSDAFRKTVDVIVAGIEFTGSGRDGTAGD